ncbi:Bidirectional sugar transporter SWEET10 [Platanthera zijinensis]|uniref:Bidirectional sugar transporter SWEET10 n=1 Tax=Platanthera zijinensis TaxID=2320716 RepID=A0AAP0BQZ3_9ASPA
MLWVYYACVKSNALLLLIINFIGCVVEIGYILMSFIYAPRSVKLLTARAIAFLSIAMFELTLARALLLSYGHRRTIILGWICASYLRLPFFAPLSIMDFMLFSCPSS